MDEDFSMRGLFHSVCEAAVVKMGVGEHEPADVFDAVAPVCETGDKKLPVLCGVGAGIDKGDAVSCVDGVTVGKTDLDRLQGRKVKSHGEYPHKCLRPAAGGSACDKDNRRA